MESDTAIRTGKINFKRIGTAPQQVIAAAAYNFAQCVQNPHGFRTKTRRAAILKSKSVSCLKPQPARLCMDHTDVKCPVLRRHLFHAVLLSTAELPDTITMLPTAASRVPMFDSSYIQYNMSRFAYLRNSSIKHAPLPRFLLNPVYHKSDTASSRTGIDASASVFFLI